MRFGDLIENSYAADNNPRRVCYFVRRGKRSGKLNPGQFILCTDGDGDFWEVAPGDHLTVVKPSPFHS